VNRLNVLFVCIGNVCRSAMAEAMARKYGTDVMIASSAGIAPALNSHALTRAVLAELNIDLGDHVPRRLSDVDLSQYDLVVNMSGTRLGADLGVPVENWDVKDPYGKPEAEFRQARSDIEMRVMQLILRIRTGKLNLERAIDSGPATSRQ
jgi:arsenate reductase (thioredoxin)